jgi:hypothetical protein
MGTLCCCDTVAGLHQDKGTWAQAPRLSVLQNARREAHVTRAVVNVNQDTSARYIQGGLGVYMLVCGVGMAHKMSSGTVTSLVAAFGDAHWILFMCSIYMATPRICTFGNHCATSMLYHLSQHLDIK